MARPDENWYLTVGSDRAGRSVVGTVYKSLTNKLLHSRYIACGVLTELYVRGINVSGIEVAIVRDGEVQSKDSF
jgi:hypothetical protein